MALDDGVRSAAGKRPTRAEFVYQELLRWIADGSLHPSERLRETLICERLGVSRTPVREAIRRLEAEGRVATVPRRGAVVAELDPHEVVEIYTVRIELEAFAARLAAQHATLAEIDLMERILERSSQLGGDPRELNNNNWRLHKTVQIAAHNRFLSQLFDSLAGSFAMLRGVKYIPAGRPESLLAEHRKIIDAIRARDPEAAAQAAQDHVRHAFSIHMEAILAAGDPASSSTHSTGKKYQ